MTRTPVKSAAVVSVGHEGDTLEVEFAGGKVYRYRGVPAETFQEMLAAESVGRAVLGGVRGLDAERQEADPVEFEG